MLKKLSVEEFLKLAEIKPRVAVYQEFPCDDMTPSMCLQALQSKGIGVALLESAIKDKELGRYSLLAFDPIATFRVEGDHVDFQVESVPQRFSGSSFAQLRNALDRLRCAPDHQLPPLIGGSVGFLSYDAVRLFEKIPDRHPNTSQIPDLFFIFHRIHIAFDHFKGTIIFSIAVNVGANPEEDYRKALQEIADLRTLLASPFKREHSLGGKIAPIVEEMGDALFCEKVRKAKELIEKGDIFQVVLSRTFRMAYDRPPFDVYRALRLTNPSPFMFYLETEQFAVAGASPERLIKMEKGVLQTMPIAGTRPRVLGEEERIEKELLSDPKEDAEHMMLVDLGRNDLGRIAKVGTVSVKELKTVRHFSQVTHLISILEAQIKEGCDALDALEAAFPAGTLSGAPKIRAMEIIDELEESRRGLYGGAICTIDNQGELDSCIAIRMAFFQDGEVSVRTGAGIVLDSDPESEAMETRHKARGVLNAIHMVQEGII
ncbi:MAG: chorismate-binding protein [Chlamydiota bacterium]